MINDSIDPMVVIGTIGFAVLGVILGYLVQTLAAMPQGADGPRITERPGAESSELADGATGEALTPVAHYPFDRGKGPRAFDRIGIYSSLRLRGNDYTWVDGRFGSAIRFGTESSGILWNTTLPSGEEMAVSFWMKPGNWTGPAAESPILRIEEVGGLSRYIWLQGGRPQEPLTFIRRYNTTWSRVQTEMVDWQTDTWYHITAQFQKRNGTRNGKILLYVNGTLRGTASAPVIPEEFVVFGVGSGKFNGVVDDLRIYDRIISKQQIERIMKKGDETYRS